jgi:hypothetical protein
LPVKEYQIIDFFLPKLKDEVMKIKPVQKQTRAGQRTRFKALVGLKLIVPHALTAGIQYRSYWRL